MIHTITNVNKLTKDVISDYASMQLIFIKSEFLKDIPNKFLIAKLLNGDKYTFSLKS
jgi:hypothetical protein